jgi:hypothetical protein
LQKATKGGWGGERREERERERKRERGRALA